MKNTIDYKNLDNVAGGFEMTNEEELKRLYEENKKNPDRPQYATFEGFKNALAMKSKFMYDIRVGDFVQDGNNEELLLEAPHYIEP